MVEHAKLLVPQRLQGTEERLVEARLGFVPGGGERVRRAALRRRPGGALTSLTARSPTGCSSRQPGSAAPSARIHTPALHSPDPSCRWPGCCSGQSSAGPAQSNAAEAGPGAQAGSSEASYLHDPHLSGDLRQRGVEVVGGQGLRPQSLVLVGPNPARQRERVSGAKVEPEQPGRWTRARSA